jgi:hypothetical protein
MVESGVERRMREGSSVQQAPLPRGKQKPFSRVEVQLKINQPVEADGVQAGEQAGVKVRAGAGLVVAPVHAPAVGRVFELGADEAGDVARVPASASRQRVTSCMPAGLSRRSLGQTSRCRAQGRQRFQRGAVIGLVPAFFRVMLGGVEVLVKAAQAGGQVRSSRRAVPSSCSGDAHAGAPGQFTHVRVHLTHLARPGGCPFHAAEWRGRRDLFPRRRAERARPLTQGLR